MILQEYMNRHLPTGERLARLRAVIDTFASSAKATGEEGVDACIDLAADMFEAIEPEPEGAEIKAVALQMIEERIDQISFGSLSAAIVFDRIPDEG